jgi:leucyl aminopeptidase
MDFKTVLSPAAGLANVSTEALVVVIVGQAVPPALDKPLAALLSDAVKHGDFEFKAGRCLYMHRPGNVKAARLAFVAAALGLVWR